MDPQEAGEGTDGRMSFDEALARLKQGHGDAFAVTPVFEDDQEAAAGARVFVLMPDETGAPLLRYVAAPFFSAAYAANEQVPAAEAPESVRAMRFMPTRAQTSWFVGQMQLQIIIQRLVKASGTSAPQMPDYENAPSVHAGAEVVFPMARIGRPEKKPD